LTKSPRTALIAQNHCSGIRALFDDGPAPIPVGSAVNDEPQNVNVTNVNRTRDVPDVAAFHLLANIDRVIDRIGAGRAEITWKVAGTAGATPFELTRTNRFADTADVSFVSPDELFLDLLALTENPFAEVKFTSLTMDATVREAFRSFRITGLQRFTGTSWVNVSDTQPIVLTPGRPLRVRVLLAAYRSSAPVAPVEFSLPVAAGATGDGSLDIMGGATGGGEEGVGAEPKSFDELLKALRDAPRNDDIKATMTLFGGGGGGEGGPPPVGGSTSPPPVSSTKRVGEVVDGGLSIPVTIPMPPEPEPEPSEPPSLNLTGKKSLPLGASLRKGIALNVRTSATGRVVVRGYVSRTVAKRLGIKKNAKRPVVVAAVAKTVDEGRTKVTLKFTRKAKRKLSGAERVKLALKATITDFEGNRTTDRAAMVLKRK
jgi:hypothetical protein